MRAVKCNRCGTYADGVGSAIGDPPDDGWRLYFQAPHTLWNPAEPLPVGKITYIHLCSACSMAFDGFLAGTSRASSSGSQ